jgi:hypothetical protein
MNHPAADGSLQSALNELPEASDELSEGQHMHRLCLDPMPSGDNVRVISMTTNTDDVNRHGRVTGFVIIS